MELQDEISDDQATKVICRGAAAIDASRVEVPFAAVQPEANELWSRSCSEELVIRLAIRAKNARTSLGSRHQPTWLIAGHWLGQVHLAHVLVTNARLWYPPEELSLYLVDFEGVEFKPTPAATSPMRKRWWNLTENLDFRSLNHR